VANSRILINKLCVLRASAATHHGIINFSCWRAIASARALISSYVPQCVHRYLSARGSSSGAARAAYCALRAHRAARGWQAACAARWRCASVGVDFHCAVIWRLEDVGAVFVRCRCTTASSPHLLVSRNGAPSRTALLPLHRTSYAYRTALLCYRRDCGRHLQAASKRRRRHGVCLRVWRQRAAAPCSSAGNGASPA